MPFAAATRDIDGFTNIIIQMSSCSVEKCRRIAAQIDNHIEDSAPDAADQLCLRRSGPTGKQSPERALDCAERIVGLHKTGAAHSSKLVLAMAGRKPAAHSPNRSSWTIKAPAIRHALELHHQASRDNKHEREPRGS